MKMKIRFYLNQSHTAKPTNPDEPLTGSALVQKVVKHFTDKENSDRYHSMYGGENIGGLKYQKDEQGIYVDTDTFVDGIPRGILAAKLPIAFITMYDEGTTGMPQFGVYQVGQSRAIVDSFTKSRRTGRTSMMGDSEIWEDERAWRIRITGKSFNSVVGLYRKFRNSQLDPVEPWEDLAPVLVALKHENDELREALLLTSILNGAASVV